jgi:glycosyltransferase involved in cell wall biosynthesis
MADWPPLRALLSGYAINGELGLFPYSAKRRRADFNMTMETRDYVVENPLPIPATWSKGARKGRLGPRHPLALKSPRVSIIIPAHNEEKYIATTLEALKRQNYLLHEVIVVANGCTDRTAEVARGQCHRLIILSEKSLGVARNLGARLARGDLLLFLDADTLLEPGALKKITADFTPEYAAGTLRGVPDCPRLKYKFIYSVKNLTHQTKFHRGSAGVILCWRKHFMEIGGFDEGLQVSENSELMRRLARFGGYKYIRETAATTSMRRYDQRGCSRMTWLWLKLWVLSLFGDLHNRNYETIR